MKLKITKSWIVTTSIIVTLLVILFGAIIIYTITIHNSPKVGVSRFELFSDMIDNITKDLSKEEAEVLTKTFIRLEDFFHKIP